MGKILDLTGMRFDRLLVKSRSHSNQHGQSMWSCVCDCGTVKVVCVSALRGRLTKSCGCLSRENTATINFLHGKSKTPEWAAWYNMIARCTDAKNDAWKWYGARGIMVCERWLGSFSSFLSDMGLRPSPTHSLDRVDNNGNYTPQNCRWATSLEQRRNTRRNKKRR